MSFAAALPVYHPAQAPLPVPYMGHRQCDHCGRVESTLTGRILSVCAGCKFVQYCVSLSVRAQATVSPARSPKSASARTGTRTRASVVSPLRLLARRGRK